MEFRASTGDFGEGLVVVKDGSVSGDDTHYLYQMEIPRESGDFESRFTVRKYREGNVSVVRIYNDTLLAKGCVNYQDGTLKLRGAVENSPQLTIKLRGHKIQPAV
ncbi:GrlR family regulatory protein [Pseudomonas fontis]|uniref:Lipoprotein n=1 Tax=Pseudomonas fontis TaxID=2942633 RepID=A0ABT5NY27_9PSED|nr:hypothetical protein [Pseudomonas fontis]MDD0993106.1 hypothetical protein [Pseudomonas fontis]